MIIAKIYKKYSIPINLQEHMMRVAAVGSIICNNVKEISVDKDLIVKTLLLHDMGNILKFDFSKVDMLDDEDKKRVDELREIQKQFIGKYSSDPDVATIAMINEITTDKKIAELCEESHWEFAKKFLEKNLYDRMIACYSDMRVGPFGVISLKQRFDDLEVRRPEERESLKELRKQGLLLEKKIQEVANIDVCDIDDGMILDEIEKLQLISI